MVEYRYVFKNIKKTLHIPNTWEQPTKSFYGRFDVVI